MKFMSKYLKNYPFIKEQVLQEKFYVEKVKGGCLEVSEQWIKINGILVPKSFIIGTYLVNITVEPTEPYNLNFALITGEDRFSFEVGHKHYHEIKELVNTLQEILPGALITDDEWLFHWFRIHRAKIKDKFSKLISEKGLEYVLKNKTDFYKPFVNDGTMLQDIRKGSKVDIIDNRKSTKSGVVKDLLTSSNDKKGCKVLLEDRQIGRVKKVYGKSINKTCLKTVDDSDEYFEKYLEDKYLEQDSTVTHIRGNLSFHLVWAILILIFIVLTIWAFYDGIMIWL